MNENGTLSKTDLLQKMFGVEEVPLKRGGSVKVRGLSRTEALSIKGVEMPQDEMEQVLLSYALVDPKLSTDDVKTWQQNSAAGEIEDVTAVIMRLSGMEKSAPKEQYKSPGG